jgi:type III restriction enzyme
LNRSKSWKKLREVLIPFAEYYLNVFEFEARRIFLFPCNKALLIQDISLALARFEAFQTAQGNESRRAVEEVWQVPELRYYNDLYNREVVEKSAMVPFFEYNRASTEISFKEFLEQNENSIEWWYKNGDKGKEHFAIPYTNLQNELRLFYVDFVIKFRSGKIGLFDTKTKRSDLEAPNKHNALIDYIEQQNKLNSRRTLLGGIVISEEINGIVSFRYCANRISDTNDLTGWNFLNPVDLAGEIATDVS